MRCDCGLGVSSRRGLEAALCLRERYPVQSFVLTSLTLAPATQFLTSLQERGLPSAVASIFTHVSPWGSSDS
jgi:hypothetical protein